MGINFGGTLHPWDSGKIIALFVVSGVLRIVFALQQAFNIVTSFENRILPIHLFTQKEPVLLFVSCATIGAVVYTSVYYIPIYFQFTQGDSALKSAGQLLPFIFLLITTMPFSGAMMSHFGYYKPWYIGGSLIALVPAALVSSIIHVHSSAGFIYGLEVLLGVGGGASTQASFAVIQAVVIPSDAASGLTLMLLAQVGGMALGVSIAGAVFENIASNGLYALLPDYSRSQVSQIVSGTSSTLLNSLSQNLRDDSLAIIVSAWHKCFICISVAASVSLVVSLFMSHKRCNVSAAAGGE
ncbi:uncharacterized protein N7483_010684 [Penicillium malachiteum]|uniref:uncharacterized protein n=1 Tax=Penicillium malachiteum TaxID=1324776 RepID=UPI002547BC84|nr:uncharacterized protein N7483_010684 [Penicillium malachiteum]KAJ5713503.1 hypothetical protein N7483_010684 [Penicillium malachiteum]